MPRRSHDDAPDDAPQDSHDDIPDYRSPSKTEQKKAMERLQALGERLAALPAERLRALPLTGLLREALSDLKRIKALEAIRRHKQYIGKLMRDEDVAAILSALNSVTRPALDRKLEVLVERLLNQGDPAIHDVVRAYPAAERHTLRQLVRAAVAEQKKHAELQEPEEQELQEQDHDHEPEQPADAASQWPAKQKLRTYLQEVAALSE